MEKDRISKLREQLSQKNREQLSLKEKINASDYLSIIGVALLMALNAKVKYVISDLDDLSDAIIDDMFIVPIIPILITPLISAFDKSKVKYRYSTILVATTFLIVMFSGRALACHGSPPCPPACRMSSEGMANGFYRARQSSKKRWKYTIAPRLQEFCNSIHSEMYFIFLPMSMVVE